MLKDSQIKRGAYAPLSFRNQDTPKN